MSEEPKRGGFRPGAGRRPKDELKRRRISYSLPEQQIVAIEGLAQTLTVSKSEAASLTIGEGLKVIVRTSERRDPEG